MARSKQSTEWIGNCLFCAKLLPKVRKNCKLLKFSGEEFSPVGGTRTHFRRGDYPAIDPHLKTYFIVRRLLNTPVKVLQELLAFAPGDTKFEAWVKVCTTCGLVVHNFYKNFMLICKWERQMKMKASCKSKIQNQIVNKKQKNFELKDELIQKILSTMNEIGTCPIWSRLRIEALQVVDDTELIQPSSYLPKVRSNKNLKPIPKLKPTNAETVVAQDMQNNIKPTRKQVIVSRIVTEADYKIC